MSEARIEFEPNGPLILHGPVITVLDQFSSKEDRDGMLNSGMESGAAESYERLDEVLAELRAQG